MSSTEPELGPATADYRIRVMPVAAVCLLSAVPRSESTA
jgi:hypothetical protein